MRNGNERRTKTIFILVQIIQKDIYIVFVCYGVIKSADLFACTFFR